MLTRLISLLLLFGLLLGASEFPLSFAKLGTPLFKSTDVISKLSNIKELKKASKEYIVLSEMTLQKGFEADKSNSDEEKKKYLFELRDLQKKYDNFLSKLHKNINSAIQKEDYEMFYKLTSYELDGLLHSRGLFKRSVEFYKKSKSKKRSRFLDKKINYTKMIRASNSELYTKITTSTYTSLSKDTSIKSVDLFVKKSSKYLTVYARNKNAYSVTINIKGNYKNLSHANATHTFSLKPNSTKEYIKLYIGKKSYSYGFNYSWIMGSMDAVHDDSYLYRLPYARGTSKLISQGYNGEHTHKGSSQYAVDFVMNIGTKIYAARGGVVVDVKEDSNKVGYSKEFAKYGNFVTIEHDDATFGTYYHLKKFGAYAKVGDSVRRGDLIGYSGNTGYSSGPHLHFQVFKTKDARSTQSIAVKFLTQNGILARPKKGILCIAK